MENKQRYGVDRPYYIPDIATLNYYLYLKDGVLQKYEWYANKVCFGPYLGSKFPYITREVNKRLEGVTLANQQVDFIELENLGLILKVKKVYLETLKMRRCVPIDLD